MAVSWKHPVFKVGVPAEYDLHRSFSEEQQNREGKKPLARYFTQSGKSRIPLYILDFLTYVFLLQRASVELAAIIL